MAISIPANFQAYTRTARLASVFFALVLAGCVTMVSPEKAAKVDLQKTGLLLATTAATGTAKDLKHVVYDFYIRPVDPERRYSTYFISSGQPLWLIEIPPGRYRIDDWFLGSATSRNFSSAEAFEFEVRLGEITYIGHFQIAVEQAKNMFGLRVIPQGTPVLENRFSAAEEQLRRDFPALQAAPLRDAGPTRAFTWGIASETPVNLGIPPPIIK